MKLTLILLIAFTVFVIYVEGGADDEGTERKKSVAGNFMRKTGTSIGRKMSTSKKGTNSQEDPQAGESSDAQPKALRRTSTMGSVARKVINLEIAGKSLKNLQNKDRETNLEKIARKQSITANRLSQNARPNVQISNTGEFDVAKILEAISANPDHDISGPVAVEQSTGSQVKQSTGSQKAPSVEVPQSASPPASVHSEHPTASSPGKAPSATGSNKPQSASPPASVHSEHPTASSPVKAPSATGSNKPQSASPPPPVHSEHPTASSPVKPQLELNKDIDSKLEPVENLSRNTSPEIWEKVNKYAEDKMRQSDEKDKKSSEDYDEHLAYKNPGDPDPTKQAEKFLPSDLTSLTWKKIADFSKAMYQKLRGTSPNGFTSSISRETLCFCNALYELFQTIASSKDSNKDSDNDSALAYGDYDPSSFEQTENPNGLWQKIDRFFP